MSSRGRNVWLGTSATLLGFAVLCGAFGAHALKATLDSYSMSVYEKGVLYHFIHALGLLLIATLPGDVVTGQQRGRICMVLTCGIILFSGSLYLLALSGIRAFGAVAPIGGICFVVAWAYLATICFKPSAA